MNLRLAPLKALRLLAVLILIGWAALYYYRPHYSSKFRHECALNLSRFKHYLLVQRDPGNWKSGRWTGKIALVEMEPNTDPLAAHPAKNHLPSNLAAHTEEEATVVGYVRECVAPGGVVGPPGGILFVILVDLKTRQQLGIVVVKEWTQQIGQRDFAAEYPTLARMLADLHD